MIGFARSAHFVWAALPPSLLSPAPWRFLPFSHQPFSPLAPPLAFFNRAHSPCVLGSLHAGVIGGLCRRAALPVRALPPADLFRPRAGFPVKQITALAALCLQPRHEQILAHALCPDAYTPNGFVFRTTTPCDPFRPRAGFHVKQTRTPRCFMSSTASRVNSRPRPLPGSLFHLSVLNDCLA